MMVITYTDGSLKLYDTNNVASVKYAHDTWSEYARGTYYYQNLWNGTDTDLLVFRSDANPTHFYIKGWGKGQQRVDLYFTYNAENGDVFVEEQDIGYIDEYDRHWTVEDVVTRNDGNTYYGVSYYTEEERQAEPERWEYDPNYGDVYYGGTPYTPAHSFAFYLMYCPENGGYYMAYEIFTLTEFLVDE